MEEKIKALNLLRLTPTLMQYLSEEFPFQYAMLIRKPRDFEFAQFSNGSVEFFTEKYIEEHTLDELNEARARRI